MINMNIKSIKKILKTGKIVLLPITMACSIAITGCGLKSNTKTITSDNINKYSIELEENSNYVFSNYKLKIIDSAPLNLEDLESLYNNDVDTSKIADFCAIDEFTKMVNEENITWNDIHNTLESIDIDNNIKDILRNGINNLEKNKFNMNLGVLNYNLKRLTIEYGDYTEENIRGRFNCTNGLTELDNSIIGTDDFKHTIVHEILGHGMTFAYDEKTTLFTSPSFQYALLDKNNDVMMLSSIGSSLSEAIAEIISARATNEKIDFNKTEYAVYVQYLELLLKSNNIKESEFANYGTRYLVDKMINNGINDAIDYIFDMDMRKNGLENNEPFVTNCGNVDELESQYLVFSTYAKYGECKDVIGIEKFINTCVDSYKSIINTEDIDGYTCISWNNDIEGETINLDWIKYNSLINLGCIEPLGYQKTLK